MNLYSFLGLLNLCIVLLYGGIYIYQSINPTNIQTNITEISNITNQSLSINNLLPNETNYWNNSYEDNKLDDMHFFIPNQTIVDDYEYDIYESDDENAEDNEKVQILENGNGNNGDGIITKSDVEGKITGDGNESAILDDMDNSFEYE